ncbi:XdhC family protein [Chitinophaga rhizophila]|uniref:XdhC family protein n=1 Tax=Chitinophaga rhizophila TaxID=2866212 RepID=A0ABS7GH47_9BACT|nr:XdhC/CoxI family protein [Chitinophaga rhizophila]MBW8687007.1 XdhC family protein [Chitinophaga rhizophila]
MKEIEDIIRAYNVSRQSGKKVALATVVHVEGSSYRRPGARMLVTEDGVMTGAISGGCLEGDALRRALLAIIQQQNKLVTYDTTDDDDARIGVQLGCNGIVHILFEPIDPESPHHPILLLEQVLEKREDAVLVTLFRLNQAAQQPGTCLRYSGGTFAGSLEEGELKTAIVNDALEVFGRKQGMVKQYGDEKPALHGFVEILKPPVSLIIAGAGNDAIPLVQIAGIQGWHTTVVDGRALYATPARFPEARKVIVSKAKEVLDKVSIDERTVFVLMTHNYNYDLALLELLLQKEVPYIGTLGPRSKLERMLDELTAKGVHISDEDRARIHGPVGLDIGAETAEEIALSVTAEIKSVLSERTGIPLRKKNGPIHTL